MKKKLTVIDLFSGCGGLSFGLRRVGFEILLGVDSWGPSLKTFTANHSGAKVLEKDISKLETTDVQKIIGYKKIDVIVGGPPCQGGCGNIK